ncbi:MAG: hypothetical protein NTW31_14325 [Bacteroidetes bacterium]|nr:hypothetical protein [Bacteroidota bacterium]
MNNGNSLARIISGLFHPVLMPFLTLILMLQAHSFFIGLLPVKEILILMGSVLLTTVVCPFLMIFFLFRVKLVSSLFMEKREERIMPLLSIGVFYYLTYYLLKSISLSVLFSYFMLGATLLIIICLFVNFFFKISLHMAGIGGVTGFWIGLSIRQGTPHEILISFLILLCGLLGFARLADGSHSPKEVYTGLCLGAGILFSLMML